MFGERAGGSSVRARQARRVLAVGLMVAGAASPALASDTASPFCTPRSAPIPAGRATLAGEAAVAGTNGRLLDITLNAPALYGKTHVYVLLPAGYDPSGRTRYPVLYLLHGAAGTYRDWYTQGNVMGIVDHATGAGHLPPFITVMPDAGTWGFYADWYGTDVGGLGQTQAPAWATYHIKELIPWIDSHFPTIAERNARAIAGLSMGGFGSMSYASRFPDLFSSAGSFSGAVNPDYEYPYGPTYLTGASGPFNGGQAEQCVWGDEATQQVHWEGDDPTYLAGSLASTSLFFTAGGGDASQPTGLAPTDPIEENTYLMSKAMIAALDADQIPHTDDFYGPGTHSFSYWQADLANYLPLMWAAFRNPPAAPPAVTFSYRSILTSFGVWGWSFTAHRDVTEFTYLEKVGPRGLQVTGSGKLGVLTARLFRPGAAYRLTQGWQVMRVRADRLGRLAFTVDLGPSHTSQQASFDSQSLSSWTTVRVSISALATPGPRRPRRVRR